MPNPLADNQTYGVPTAGSLGITTASQIGVLFNATEPSSDSINVLDVTLKFYNAATRPTLSTAPATSWRAASFPAPHRTSSPRRGFAAKHLPAPWVSRFRPG